MSERGAFAIDRGVFEHRLFADEPFSRREAWMWMIGEAAWSDRTKRAGGVDVALSRGQIAASLRFLAEKWMWSKSTVERFLAKLKSEGMISADVGQGVLVITICNYDRFQRGPAKGGTGAGHQTGHQTGHPRRGKRDSDEQSNPQPELAFSEQQQEQRDTSEAKSGTPNGTPNGTNTNKDTNKAQKASPSSHRARKKPRTEFPVDWRPSEAEREFARRKQPSWSERDIDDQFERFRDRNLATGSAYADWPAAWRTWVTSPYQRPATPPGRGPPAERRNHFADIAAEAHREITDGYRPDNLLTLPIEHLAGPRRPGNGHADPAALERAGGGSGQVAPLRDFGPIRAIR